MRRLLVFPFVIAIVLAASVQVAFAHAEIEPTAAAPGSIIPLTLKLENEQSDAGTVKVEMRFSPDTLRIPVVALTAPTGWTATVVGGEVGGSGAQGIDWTRPSGPPTDNPELPFTIGPLPTQAGPLEFKVVQTYSNGEVDRWIEETPPGGPEPEHPAPTIELRAGAAGEIPSTTLAPTPTTVAAPTTTGAAVSPATTAPPAKEDDDDSAVPIIVAILIALAVIGGGAAYIVRRRSHKGTS
jgi:uncharacterized protein